VDAGTVSRAANRRIYARTKQYKNNPIPRTKKRMNRPKKRGPISAASNTHNLMDH